ncbi:hypothetical protein SFV1gp53 [Sulfolobus filamentous virus 1]|uniref:Uncharacterized protein n=2 Tax=Alphalipothrixvirus beppuense TaxID=2734584 RepID=A0A346LU92_SUFV1|nr:hypothetical protein HOT91_gp53 [Sulfolobus filamentous virus 1]AXQ00135.1 hypothetical protein SFV1gp53 [Sulfolobus filamentous virus 1]AZI75755.1 hypothetical protein SBFV1_gp54 [Sulfolobales Beppu filamentous phage 1]
MKPTSCFIGEKMSEEENQEEELTQEELEEKQQVEEDIVLDESKIKEISEGIPAKVVSIKKGRLLDLIGEVRNTDRLSEKALDWIKAQGEEPYLLITCDVEGSQKKFLVHYTWSKNSTLYKMVKKYKRIAVGTEILVKFNPEAMRYQIVTD